MISNLGDELATEVATESCSTTSSIEVNYKPVNQAETSLGEDLLAICIATLAGTSA